MLNKTVDFLAVGKSGYQINLEREKNCIREEKEDAYTEYKDARPEIGMWNQDWTLPEPAVSDYSEELLSGAEEGQHYLELSNREKELLELVCSKFDNVTVIVNINNAMELGWLDDYEQIGSAVWAPCPGQSGFSALGKIMSGEVNPSGRMVDTFLRNLTQTL